MDHLAQRRLPRAHAGLLAAVAALMLGGCASMSQDQCTAADWRTVGYTDGVRGAPPDRIAAHQEACAKHGVTPDLTRWLQGRESGLQQYCQPGNGFRVGLAGNGYANVCSAALEPAFLGAYQQGREIYSARSAYRSAASELSNARAVLNRIDTSIQTASTELIKQDLSADRRAALAADLVKLGQDRRRTLDRIEQAARNVGQAEAVMRAAEGRSPYPL